MMRELDMIRVVKTQNILFCISEAVSPSFQKEKPEIRPQKQTLNKRPTL